MIDQQIEDPYAYSPLIAGPRGSRLGGHQAGNTKVSNSKKDPKRKSSNEKVKQALLGIVEEFNTKGDPRNADKVMNFINQMK